MAEDDIDVQSELGDGGDRLSDAERSIVNALRAPVPVDAAAFDARVMAAVRREPVFARSRRRSHRGLALASTGMLAVGAIVLFVVGTGRNVALDAQHPAVALNASAARKEADATARAGTRTVRFTLVASGASRVAIAGSFNGWSAGATPLRREGKDRWTADVPLGAGRYEYQFVIDGNRWVADPRAPRDAGDDFGTMNSVVTVPLPGSA